MYEQFYGLKERPFDLSPNPRFLFLSSRHSEALNHLRYGLSGRPGLTVLVGDAGTGKTTLIKAALLAARADADANGAQGSHAASTIVHLSNPTLTRAEFYEYLAAGFGFSDEVAKSKTRFLRELEVALADRATERRTLALVVDEAQSLPHELLEEIRLLTNVESPSGQTLTVALVGQPELAVRLNETRLRQLKQRVSLRCELTPLDLQETAAYIAARVRVAGGAPELMFTKGAVAAVHEHARGIPRTISVICDNALVNGFAADLRPVTRDVILEVCRDFQFAQGPTPNTKGTAAPKSSSSFAPPVEAPSDSEATRVEPDETEAMEAVATDTAEGPEAKPMFSGFSRPRRFSFF